LATCPTVPSDRDLSVVIPTRNRAERLARCLDALKRQTLPPQRFEVLVVDNGSDEAALDAARQSVKPLTCRKKVLVEPRPGPAAARNRGIEQARGERVLFIGDDILAAPDLLAQHLDGAARHGDRAILGFTDWAPYLRVTPFMRYLAPERGPQFRYGTIENPLDCGYQFFYTSNISLARRWFDLERFDEAFPYACFEDADLGYRLQKRGLNIVFFPVAVAYHDHPIRFRDFLARIRQMGESNVIFTSKYPELRADPNIVPSEGHRAKVEQRMRRLRTAAIERLVFTADRFGIPLPERMYRRVLEDHFVRAYFAALDRGQE